MHFDKQNKILIEKFLKNIPVFRNFSENNLKQTIQNFSVMKINKNKTIVFQSEDSTDLYIVLQGRVKVTIMDPEGNEFVLTTFRKGDFFGEMSLLDGKSRSATVSAEEKTLLGVLKRERFLNAIKENSLIAIDLLTALVERLRKADEIIESFAFLQVKERLLKYLVECTHDACERDEKGFYKIKKLTQRGIASRIGASREAVSKVLINLISKQYILEKEGCYLLSPYIYDQANKGFIDGL